MTERGLFLESRFAHGAASFVVNVLRSTPFVILQVLLLALTQLVRLVLLPEALPGLVRGQLDMFGTGPCGSLVAPTRPERWDHASRATPAHPSAAGAIQRWSAA